jgi:hypothetical protein
VPAYALTPFDESNWDTVHRLADAAIPFDLLGNRRVIDSRKSFDTARYTRQHYSVIVPQTGTMIGYGAVEQQPDEASFRMFIILQSGDLWESAGEMLYQRLLGDLHLLSAPRVWWREYANDLPLLRFVKAHGFVETDRITDLRAPLSVDAVALIVLGFQPVIQGDQQQVIIHSTDLHALDLAEQFGFKRAFVYVRLEKQFT